MDNNSDKPGASKAKKDEGAQTPLKALGRGRAVMVVALCILIALFIGGRRGLMKQRNAAQRYFYGVDEQDMDSVNYWINERINSSGNLVTLAERYLSGDEAKEISEVKKLRESLQKTENTKEKYKYNEELTASCEELSAKLTNYPLSKKEFQLVEGILADMNSALQVMGHLEYNVHAQAFNSMLEEFPVSIVRLYTFVKPLTLFDY